MFSEVLQKGDAFPTILHLVTFNLPKDRAVMG